jgi:hypothetical protein
MSTTAIMTCPVLPVDRSASLAPLHVVLQRDTIAPNLSYPASNVPWRGHRPLARKMSKMYRKLNYVKLIFGKKLSHTIAPGRLIDFGPRAVADREDNKVR